MRGPDSPHTVPAAAVAKTYFLSPPESIGMFTTFTTFTPCTPDTFFPGVQLDPQASLAILGTLDYSSSAFWHASSDTRQWEHMIHGVHARLVFSSSHLQ
jgi:hypothetical protein